MLKPFPLLLDASKVFNGVSFVKLFRLLVKRDFYRFLGRLLHTYKNQGTKRMLYAAIILSNTKLSQEPFLPSFICCS